jgi:hypothetical protein
LFFDVFMVLPAHLARQRDELASEAARLAALRAARGIREG